MREIFILFALPPEKYVALALRAGEVTRMREHAKRGRIVRARRGGVRETGTAADQPRALRKTSSRSLISDTLMPPILAHTLLDK